ncbi:hypothetical protein AB7849_15555 [Rhodanobacter sp. 115]|uniref:hypothetical protein n=1 Tax=Rhodanobacter sp. FW021-MT20 TaxID=1162282 RepID=UPI0034E57797
MRLLETSLYLLGCGCLVTLAAICAMLCWSGPALAHAWPLIWAIAITGIAFGIAGCHGMRCIRAILLVHLSNRSRDEVLDAPGLPSNDVLVRTIDSAAA